MFEMKGRETQLFRSSPAVRPPGWRRWDHCWPSDSSGVSLVERSLINLSFALVGRKQAPASTALSFGLCHNCCRIVLARRCWEPCGFSVRTSTAALAELLTPAWRSVGHKDLRVGQAQSSYRLASLSSTSKKWGRRGFTRGLAVCV